ncbi:molybdopterin molybdotransferase MoeA [Cobetia sp. L2A1]|uniref:molybdopterin molybdotransferase MoeA n=1 Tax=Cobetia sp. L2A1 TaxID=2686360 RepID=UPI00131BB86E|nr:molybdopterin-binding protein [Cobetia sp. L2A1]
MSLSCFDPMFGERMLSVDEALTVLGESLDAMPRTRPTERITLDKATGRILAETIVSPLDVPAQTNAAMDGIALAHASLARITSQDSASDVCELRVIGSSLAGHPWQGRALEAGEALRITTGAALPAGADSVVMQEQLQYFAAALVDAPTDVLPAAGAGDAERVVIEGASSVRQGQNVRQAGEDIACGSDVMSCGQWLTPAAIGVLASLGLAEVTVYRPVTVAVFSTGDEVTAPGDPLPMGGIFDANRYSLSALLAEQGIDVLDLGILSDDRDALIVALQEAASRADMVITSGGVSVGEADHVRAALEACGQLALWRIAMRPGRPLAFGTLSARDDSQQRDGQVPFFGLPGNPVATMVTFLQFVLPALRQMSGQHPLIAMPSTGLTGTPMTVERSTDDTSPDEQSASPSLACWQSPRLQLIAGEAMRSRPERVDYHRGRLVLGADGRQVVMTTGKQGSGILTSMLAAECLIEIPAGCASIEAGKPVMVQWLGRYGVA